MKKNPKLEGRGQAMADLIMADSIIVLAILLFGFNVALGELEVQNTANPFETDNSSMSGTFSEF